MKEIEQPPRRESFKTDKDYNQAYFDYLCFRYPDLNDSTIGAILKRRLLNNKNLEDESGCATKNSKN